MNLRNAKLSRRALLQLAAGASAATLAGRLPAAPSRPATFQNPLFAGDYADPSILRVGGDFYFTHTSYRYAPGLVVWHSRDLVNWTPLSRVLHDMQGTRGSLGARTCLSSGALFHLFPDGRHLCGSCRTPPRPLERAH